MHADRKLYPNACFIDIPELRRMAKSPEKCNDIWYSYNPRQGALSFFDQLAGHFCCKILLLSFCPSSGHQITLNHVGHSVQLGLFSAGPN